MPGFDWLGGCWSSVVAWLTENGQVVPQIVFVRGIAESIAFVSHFVPSTALFFAIGTADSPSGGNFVTSWLAGASGAAVGDAVSYALGRRWRDDLYRIWPFPNYSDLLPRCQNLFENCGILAIFAGKFMGTTRPFLPVVAGAMTMPWFRFLATSAASSLARAGVFLAPGYGVSLLSG